MKEGFFKTSSPETSSDMEFPPTETEQPQSSVFTPGEIFDANEELEKLKNFHGTEGLMEVEKFKNKLKAQKEGLAEIQSQILNYISYNDYTLADLLKLANSLGQKYALSPEQKEKTVDIITQMDKKAKGIKEVLSDCKKEDDEIDGPKLYEKIFGAPAKGAVEVIANPVSLYFRFNNNDDYAYLISNAYKKHRPLTKADQTFAKRMGGAKLEKLSNSKIRDVVIVESPLFFDSKEHSMGVLAHERLHVINGFIHKFHLPDFENGLKLYKKAEKNPNFNGEADFLRLAVENPKIESRIKDEICAYFRDGTSSKEISKSLLSEGTIYDYGLDYNYSLHEDDQDFPLEYIKMVEDGIVAFSELLDNGYKVYQAVNILYTEPLLKWPKVAERMIGKQINDLAWEKKRSKYISKKILNSVARLQDDETL